MTQLLYFLSSKVWEFPRLFLRKKTGLIHKKAGTKGTGKKKQFSRLCPR